MAKSKNKLKERQRHEDTAFGFPEIPGTNCREHISESKYLLTNFPTRIPRRTERNSQSRSRKRERENHGV
jgi:hypothetical protein